MRNLLPLALLPALALPLAAQVKPGTYLAALVIRTTQPADTPGELYAIDQDTWKATKLTLPALFQKVAINCIYAMTPATGFLGTFDGNSGASPASAGDIYSYAISGTTVTVNQLNTAPLTGGNVAQIAPVGATLYFTTQNAANANGLLWSLPIGGGAPKLEVDFTTVPGFNNSLMNACAAVGGKVYAHSGWGMAEQIWEFDPLTSKVSLLMTLPNGMYTTFNYPVHMCEDTSSGELMVIGLYRDVLWIDIAKAAVTRQVNGGKYDVGTSKPHHHQMLNAGVFNPDTGDVALGTRVGNLDIIAGDHGTLDFVVGVGSDPTPGNNSVAGLTYVPAKAIAPSYGASGKDAGTTYQFYPINLNLGLPFAGQNFGYLCHGGPGGAPAILMLGLSDKSFGGITLPFDLTVWGAPGNSIYCSFDLALATVMSGTGQGLGMASFPFSLPQATLGATLFSQWVVIDPTANPLGVITTNGRKITIQ